MSDSVDRANKVLLKAQEIEELVKRVNFFKNVDVEAVFIEITNYNKDFYTKRYEWLKEVLEEGLCSLIDSGENKLDKLVKEIRSEDE